MHPNAAETGASRKKTKTPAVLSSGSVTKKRNRGAAFSQDEALLLAKAWVQQSTKHIARSDDAFWKGVVAIFHQNKFNRSLASLKGRWLRLKQECELYLHAKQEAISARKPDWTEAAVLELAMLVFRRKAALAKGSSRYYSPEFKYVSTADYLATEPKFLAKLPKGLVNQLSGRRQGSAGQCAPSQVSVTTSRDIGSDDGNEGDEPYSESEDEDEEWRIQHKLKLHMVALAACVVATVVLDRRRRGIW